MKSVGASETKAQLSQLLDKIERGESVVITRRGRAIAPLVPEPSARQEEVDKAVAGIMARRKSLGKACHQEILSWIREGRRF